jgi:hypothetical protein
MSVGRDIAAFRYIASNQPVGVLDTAFLPRVVGITEVDWRTNQLTQLTMPRKGDVIVKGEAFERAEFSDNGTEHIFNLLGSSGINSSDDGVATDAFMQHQQRCRAVLSAADNEVTLPVSVLGPDVCSLWPLINKDSVFELGDLPLMSRLTFLLG